MKNMANQSALFRSMQYVICGLIVVCGIAGCERPPQGQGQVQGGGEGPGKRPQKLALTPEQEMELGHQAYQKVLAEERGKIEAWDSPAVQKVRSITGRLVRAVGIEPLQKEMNLNLRGYRFAWEVNVVRSDKVNAFCLPGGRMVVYSGILEVAKRDNQINDDQVATVLSHEIAHALAHHASERIARDESGRGTFLRSKSYDRFQESEADKIGVFLMTFAGFDPKESIRFWDKMSRLEGHHNPEFLSDHPSPEHRMRDLQIWVPRAEAGKKAFDSGNISR